MIEALLNPILYQINSEISVVTLTAAVKVFAFFAGEAAEDWNLELYNDAKSLVTTLMRTLSGCATSPEVEVQERVSWQFMNHTVELALTPLIPLGRELCTTVPFARCRSIQQ